jgi:type I restriction enzyme, S subunit
VKNKTTKESWIPVKPEVPEGWCVCDFDKAFDPVSVNKKKIKTKAYESIGKYPVIDQGEKFISGFTDKKAALLEASKGLLVFGDHTRRFKFVDFDFAPGADGIKVLEPVYHDPKCSFFLCCAISLPNKGYSRHYSFLKKTYIPLPPANEQKRIVSKIEELFSAIEKGEAELKRIQSLIQRYRQSVLKAAVTGELTREWREKNLGTLENGEALLARIFTARRKAWEKAELEKMRAIGQKPKDDKWKKKYKEPQRPDSSNLPELPEGWRWASIDQLNVISQNGFGKRRQDSGMPVVVLRLADIIDGKIATKNNRKINALSDEIDKYKLSSGDMLWTRVNGSKALVGRISIASPNVQGFLFCDHFIRTRSALQDITEWVKVVSDSSFFRDLLLKEIKTSAGQNTISQASIKKLPIPIASNREIILAVNELNVSMSNMSNLENTIFALMDRNQKLKQSILKTAFSGTLVPQDPDDEPASELQKRIAETRAKAKPNNMKSRVGRNRKPRSVKR